MLARLDSLDGVTESRVDWTGTRFLVGLDADAAEGAVAARAAEALGEGARIAGEPERRAALDAYRRGEAWMRAGETLRLSRFEAGVLAERHGGEAARELGLEREAEGRLVALFEAELVRAFERSHAGAGIEEVPGEVEAAAGRILDASADFLAPSERAALAGFLQRFLE